MTLSLSLVLYVSVCLCVWVCMDVDKTHLLTRGKCLLNKNVSGTRGCGIVNPSFWKALFDIGKREIQWIYNPGWSIYDREDSVSAKKSEFPKKRMRIPLFICIQQTRDLMNRFIMMFRGRGRVKNDHDLLAFCKRFGYVRSK